MATQNKKRKSGIPTGNAGEYFVMGELLRRGFDAQLADRNTREYDLLVEGAAHTTFRKVQVKTARDRSWYVKLEDFKREGRGLVSVYVLLSRPDSGKPVRFFIVKNRHIAEHIHRVPAWRKYGFISLSAIEKYEDRWQALPR